MTDTATSPSTCKVTREAERSQKEEPSMSSDIDLNEIGVLKRREIEARILTPILEALGNEFGRNEVIEITRTTITEIARHQGRELA